MYWKIFAATFSAIFLAELADKTQLIGISLAAKTGRPLIVWLGSVSAYMVVTIVTVLLGATVAKHISPDIIRYTGAALFIIMGLLIFLGKI